MFKQKRPSGRPRTGRSDERHGGSGGSSHGRSSGHHHHARPRGLSDANQSQLGSSGEGGQASNPGQTNGGAHRYSYYLSICSLYKQQRHTRI